MNNELVFYVFYFALPVVAYAITGILLQPGELLGRLGDLIDRLPQWLAKPLGMCSKCFAGQLALWSYPFYADNYRIDLHIVSVCWAVFAVYFIQKFDK